MYFLYSLVLTIGFLVLLPRFLWDAATKGKYADGFWQRLGFLPDFDSQDKKIVWLHCVSVGETNAAKSLVKKLGESFPDYRLVVSTTTKTGQTLAQEIFGKDAALVFYFPFDWRFVVRRVLRKIRPDAVLIVETELWFNFLREAKRQGARVALVNGRLSEKSFKNYSLIKNFVERALSNLDAALMSGDADAERIVRLGCRREKVFVSGNVKFDLPIDERENELTEQFRRRFALDRARPLIVAASTHAPEEQLILAAYKILRENFTADNPRLMIVPRHPERFAEVAGLIEKTNYNFARRSAEIAADDERADVILLDSIGELRAVYPLAEIVFVGGSLIPHGGQNVLEPAAARQAIATGFYTHNFAAIIGEFVREDAIVQLPRLNEEDVPSALAEVFAELLRDGVRRDKLAGNARAVLLANGGATDRTIEKLKLLLAGSEPDNLES